MVQTASIKLVINLPERKDRLERFKEDYSKLYDDDFIIIEGVRKEPSFHGIAEAHMKAIQYAKDRGLPQVTIMEDDLWIPSIGARSYLNEAMEKVPEDWQVLLGGVYWLRAEKRINNYWKKIGEFCALSWYTVKQDAYDTLLNYDYKQHYDRWVGCQGLKVYCTNRYFAIQHDGYSDNVKKETRYNSKYINRQDLLK